MTKAEYRAITLTINQDQEDFLDKVRKEIKRSGGFSLARTEIVRAAIEGLRLLDPDLKNIKREEDLVARILSSIKKSK
jgi:hypothetical protein